MLRWLVMIIVIRWLVMVRRGKVVWLTIDAPNIMSLLSVASDLL